jgi:carboxymethylenebutenolidase
MSEFLAQRLSLASEVPITRRTFAVTSLAAGFAASVMPVSAATITTDTEGLDVAEVKVPVSDGEIPAYRARPKGGSNEPVILVVQEIFGVHEWIKDVCRRFAKLGYYAIASSYYARQGDVLALTSIDEIRPIVMKVPDAQVMSDLDATAAFAKTEKADTAKLGVTGFCWGGRITWLYAAHNPDLKAGVAWYGQLVAPDPAVSPPSPLRPKYPVDLVGELKAPVLGLYGALDKGISVESVDKMKAALKAADSPSNIILYPDADHGFLADYRPMYHEASAKDGWSKAVDWFKKNGVG